ncbi:MAG: Activator of 2-hydroxyglutaryl-CoA dehydratase [Firmicutes bacterium]|nr:Activator of 2-hydroxyglutaryl-CoA dehydratase [Bacillota bacterium]MDI6705289.1 acyl-CoA dehydratase activase [Bacillota bacterium]
MKKSYYLGVDVGSVSTNIVLVDDNRELVYRDYLRTMGQPIRVIQEGIRALRSRMGDIDIKGAGATGSGRNLAGIIIGADIVKNEITAHAVAALHINPEVKTILEIGGQDSKIIILRDGIVSDFAMNTVCAAGTGSFLDRQASRLGIPIEEFGALALKSTAEVRIAGRCAVFAESDMIHKQQLGHKTEDIILGLCSALVRNYLNNLGKGKEILEPVIFQGGVAANCGIVKAFEKELGLEVNVPPHHDVMGAIGAALLSADAAERKGYTSFTGLDIVECEFSVRPLDCKGCANLCEVIEIMKNGEAVACWGDRCGRWSNRMTKLA